METNRYRFGPRPLIEVAIGAMLGIILILSPWTYVSGIVFDTRSVLLCVSDLFFGAIPTCRVHGDNCRPCRYSPR